MLRDALNLLAESAATGNVGTNNLGDVINLEDVRDIGAGKPIYFHASVATAIAAGAGGTIRFEIVSADNAALSTNVVVHHATATLDAAAGIAAGTDLIKVALPAEVANGEYGQYLGFREVVGTANTSAGAVDAHLVLDQRAYKAYPNQQVQP